MKNRFLYVLFILICSLLLVPYVYAEDEEETTSTETETAPKCDAIRIKELRQKAEKVTGTYEFVYDNNNNVIGFNYLIYNIPDDMYVSYTGMKSQKVDTLENVAVVPVDSETGIGKVFDDNLTDTYYVTFSVYQNTDECGINLNTFKIKKLRYNPYSELETCKYAGLEDFIYCQEWVDTEFPYSSEEVKKRIESKVDKEKGNASSECVSCEENLKNEEEYNKLVLVRKLVIFGLISGIIIDLVVIVYLFRKVGESRI